MDSHKNFKLKILKYIKEKNQLQKYAISFTTTQIRIPKIIPMLDSITKQTIQPNIILLNIPKSIVVPDKISEYCKTNDITINFLNNDYGPATKLLGALKYSNINDYDVIITVDDDICYPKTMIKHYKILNKRYNKCTLGISGQQFNKNKRINSSNGAVTNNFEITETSILEGFASISYIQKFIDNDIFNIINYPYFNIADDAHLSNYMAKKTNLFVTSSPYLNKNLLNILEYGKETDALHVQNHHNNNYRKVFNFYNLINNLYIKYPKNTILKTHDVDNKWNKNKKKPDGNSQYHHITQ